jgi:putative transposase
LEANDPVIGACHTHIVQNTCERVNLAFQAFWRRCKAGQNPGYPRFKGEGRYDSFTFKDPNRGFSLKGDRTLRLSGIGDVRIKKHRPIEGKIKRLTVHRDGTGCWFACFSVEVEPAPLPESSDAIGIDVGIEKFAVLSDGTRIENPRFLKQDDGRLRKVQRQLSESPKGSERRRKKRKAFGKVWKKVENRRKDFAHKLSRKLVEEYQVIVFDDLNIRGMTDNGWASLNRSIADAAWNQLVRFTQYKAENAGRECVLVDPRNTSQECSGCGEVVRKDLSVRVHDCPHCGCTLDRDVNAAKNVLSRGLARLSENL